VIRDLILKNRSVRRFQQDQKISCRILEELLELAIYSASGANRQPLKYLISCEPEGNGRIFPFLAWAGYLEDWEGPGPGERPAAYIIILGDRRISENFGCDHGIAAQSILLGAVEKGLAGCMIGSIEREKLREELDISERFKMLLVLALGVPAEKVVIETARSDGDIRYWRDRENIHHVPKRPLSEILLGRV